MAGNLEKRDRALKWEAVKVSYNFKVFLTTLFLFIVSVSFSANSQIFSKKTDTEITVQTYDNLHKSLSNVEVTITYPDNQTASCTTDSNGSANFSLIPTGVNDNPGVIAGYELNQNYPNPFNPGTMISYSIRSMEDVNIQIYNILGQKVKSLVNEQQTAGTHAKFWDGKNDHGQMTSSGIYIYQIKAGNFTQSKKMVHMKNGTTHAPISANMSYANNTNLNNLTSSVNSVTEPADSMNVQAYAVKKDSVLGQTIFELPQTDYKLPLRGTSSLDLTLGRVEQNPVVLTEGGNISVTAGDTVTIPTVFYDANKDLLEFTYDANKLTALTFENGNFKFLANEAGVDTVKIYGSDGQDYATSSSVVNVGDLVTAAIPTQSYNEDEVSPDAFNVNDYFNAQGVTVDIDSEGSVTLSNATKDFNGIETGKVIANYDGKTKELDLTVTVSSMDDIRGTHKDVYTETSKKATVTVNGTEYQTDDNGNFDVQVTPGANHTLEARQYEGTEPTGFIRTRTLEGNVDNNSMEVFSVGYPATVSADTFKAFMEEGNTGDSGAGDGGKFKFYDENNMKYVIMKSSPMGTQYDFTEAQQDSIIDIIQKNIFNELGFSIPIEKKDSSYTLPEDRKGTIHIMGYAGFTVGTEIVNNRITEADIGLVFVNSNYIDQITEECVSPIFMPFEIQDSISKDKSLLHRSSNLSGLQEVDKLAYKVAKQYKTEDINNVLKIN